MVFFALLHDNKTMCPAMRAGPRSGVGSDGCYRKLAS